MNGLTDYQAKYLAHELTLRARSDSVEKLATALADAQVDLNPHQVWQLTCHALRDHAAFNEDDHSFVLQTNPFPEELVHPGPYRMGQKVEDANTFRVGHVLAQRIIAAALARELAVAEVTFGYSGSGKKWPSSSRWSGRRDGCGASGWR